MANQSPTIAAAKARAAKRKQAAKAAQAAKTPVAPPPRVLPEPVKAEANQVIAAIQKAAMGAVTATAAKSTNDMSPAAVADAAPALEAAINKAVAADPIVQNATNSEAHFYQKRSFWATVASVGAGGSAAIVAFADYMSTRVGENEQLSYVTIGFALWAGYSAFRAGRAKVPLGASTPPTSRYPLNK